MAHLGMFDSAPQGVPTVTVIGDGNSEDGISSPVDGFFVSAVDLGQSSPAGGLIGRITDERNVTLAEIRSEADSVVVMLRYYARVVAGDSLAIVAHRADTSTTGTDR